MAPNVDLAASLRGPLLKPKQPWRRRRRQTESPKRSCSELIQSPRRRAAATIKGRRDRAGRGSCGDHNPGDGDHRHPDQDVGTRLREKAGVGIPTWPRRDPPFGCNHAE